MGSAGIAGRSLVLGGAGFMGSHLVDALLHEDCRVRVFDRLPRPAGLDADVEFCKAEFTNRAELMAALDGCHTVFHLLATTDPRTSNEDPVHDLESNLTATVRLLDLARISGVTRIVFASSGGTVYGVPNTVPVAEHHETRPISSYGIHKLAIERYLDLYYRLYGIDYRVLRISNAFGERQHPNGSQGAVTVFLDKALRRQEIDVWGDGSVVRDYVYVRDVAIAFCQAARHAGMGRTFNIGTGRGISVNDLLSSIEALLGVPVSRRYLATRPFDVPINVLDVSLAAEHLGWRPQHSFEYGLSRTLEWLQADDRRGQH
jgi:UDP-glucose 4-epimerase